MKRFVLFLLGCAFSALAVNDQHAIWVSQSTQGTMWRGGASIINEHNRIIVQPNYLDVEGDWVFGMSGSAPDTFKNALEIVGNVNLAQDASVIGMLLWNGDQILKAKLKPVNIAQQQYEQVVDRNAPVPPKPCDPVIFEYGWANSNYYLSVFPVSWGGTRKARIRYLVPAVNFNGAAEIPFPYSLSSTQSSITLIKGAGVSSIILDCCNGQKTVITSDSITFTPRDALYANVRLIRPVVMDTAPHRSVIYTGTFTADSGIFSGSMSHVVGLPAAEIIARAGILEDIVIIWRWNHPEVLQAYAWQLKKQAAVIAAFCSKLDRRNKRAGMIVNIAGKKEIVFSLGNRRNGQTRMMNFLDSLQNIQAVQPSGGSPFSYSQRQIDSVVQESTGSLTACLARADSMLARSSVMLKTVLLVTAGPRRVYDTRKNMPMITGGGNNVSLLYTAVAAANMQNVDINSIRDLYWPGYNTSGISSANQAFSVTAKVSSGTDTLSSAVTTNSGYRTNFYWYYTSLDLDLKIYSVKSLNPEILWTVSSNNRPVGIYRESPLIINLADGKLLATAMAGTAQVKALGATLPGSLAGTLGFVDPKYALLALEQDVLPQPLQERYRFAGVPVLADSEIQHVEQNTTAENLDSRASTAIAQHQAYSTKDVRISLAGNALHLALSDKLRNAGREMRLQIFSVSGRLIYEVTLPVGSTAAIQAILPARVLQNQTMLVIHISIGSEIMVRKLAVH